MTDIKVEINIKSHGNWNNTLSFEGDYEKAKEQIDLFYEEAKTCMDKVIERVVAYHDGVAKHIK